MTKTTAALRLLALTDHGGDDRGRWALSLADRRRGRRALLAGVAADRGRALRRLRRRGADGTIEDVTPAGSNVRTPRARVRRRRVRRRTTATVFFANFADQRLYRQRPRRRRRGRSPRAGRAAGLRYADARVDAGRPHRSSASASGTRPATSEAVNDARRAAGRRRRRAARRSPPGTTSTPSPRLSPDGRAARLADLGPPATCPGTAPSCGSAELAADGTRRRRRAGRRRRRRSRSSSRSGRRTACCTSSPTAAAGGTSTAERGGAVEAAARRWRPSSASRSGSSACRTYAFARPTAASSAPTPSGGVGGSAMLDAGSGTLDADRHAVHRDRRRRSVGAGTRRLPGRRRRREPPARRPARPRPAADSRSLRALERRRDRPRLPLRARADRVPDRAAAAPRTPSSTRRRNRDFDGAGGRAAAAARA